MNRLLKFTLAALTSAILLTFGISNALAYSGYSNIITRQINRHHLKNNEEAYIDLGQRLNVNYIEIELHDHDENYKFELYVRDQNGYEQKIYAGEDIDTNNQGNDICEATKNQGGDHGNQTDYCYTRKTLSINREISALRFFVYNDTQNDGGVHFRNLVIYTNYHSSVVSAPVATVTPTPIISQDFCSTDARFPQVFPDVSMQSIYFEHVQELECHNVIHGYSDNTFRPYMPVTRGEMAKIISNGMRFEEFKSCGSFRDVPTSNKFYNYISTLKCRGVINGYSDGTFRPDSYVTRAEAMKFIVSGARIRTNNPGFLSSNSYSMFSDLNNYDPLYQYVIGGQSMNLYRDVNNNQFRPNNFITRAELALYLNLVRREIDSTVISYSPDYNNYNYGNYNNYTNYSNSYYQY